MADSWIVKPKTRRLPLPGGHWLEVKERLTVGEFRTAAYAHAGTVNPDGSRKPNMDTLGMSQIVAYVVDWSMVTEDDKRIPFSLDALKALAQDKFKFIDDAVEQHILNIEIEDAEREKKTRESGAAGPPATS